MFTIAGGVILGIIGFIVGFLALMIMLQVIFVPVKGK